MPVDYRYDDDKRVLYCKMTGKLNLEEYEAFLEEVVSSAEFSPDAPSLWDLHDLDFTTITADFQRAMIRIRKSYPSRGPTKAAFVAESDLGFGLIRMYEALGDRLGDKTKAFRRIADAEEWLLQDQATLE